MQSQNIENKQQIIEVLRALLENKEIDLENMSASDYVEALAAWLEDCDGYYKNFGLEIDSEVASWQLLSDALQAATIYE